MYKPAILPLKIHWKQTSVQRYTSNEFLTMKNQKALNHDQSNKLWCSYMTLFRHLNMLALYILISDIFIIQ